MGKTQQWVIGAALAIVVVMAAGWLLLISPQRAEVAGLRSQTAEGQKASAGLRGELDVLRAQSKQLPAKRAALAKFARQVPATAAAPALIRILQQQATSAGVSLVSIAPSSPTPYVASGSVAAPLAPPGAPGAPGAAKAAPQAGLQSMTMTLSVTGSYVQLEQFVANLEGMSRLFIITAYSMAPSGSAEGGAGAATCTEKSCRVGLDLTGLVFIAPPLVLAPASTTAAPAPTTAK